MKLAPLFLKIGKIEGYSYLILLFIAMPIKYLLGFPVAVQIVGMAHGVLFVAFVLLLAVLFFKNILNFKDACLAFILSIIPFGTFYLSRLKMSH